MKTIRKSKATEKNELLRKKIEKYIKENTEQASLDELSVLLGYSSVYTGKLVKALTGNTFKKLLQSARLDIAARMLRSPNKKIGEIIFECGYENESFFRRIFKKEFGMTPLNYRRENCRRRNVKK